MFDDDDDHHGARALWDDLPQGVLVIDDELTIRIVNQRALTMTGWDTAAQVVGRSVLEFVVEDDLVFVAEGVTRTDDFDGIVLGPFQIRYVARNGDEHWSECWAYRAPPALGFGGHIVTLTAESVAERLATATRSIAAGADLAVSLGKIADSLQAYPVVATACILTVQPGRPSVSAGTWPLALPPTEGLADAPWARCGADGIAAEVPVADLPTVWRYEAERAGFEAVWVRSIDVDGSRRGVMVAWRRMAVPPTPNQERHLCDATDLAALAFSQHDHRSRLTQAALTDPLTGAGNRAGLDETIAAGVEPSGVLYLDLDDFKRVNDQLGHRAGDRLLCEVTNRLHLAAGPRDEVFRIGGDEFVVLCDCHGMAGSPSQVVGTIAERIVRSISQPVVIQGMVVDISASVGVAAADGVSGVGDLLERADRALLQIKQSGKRRWSDSDPATPSPPERARS